MVFKRVKVVKMRPSVSNIYSLLYYRRAGFWKLNLISILIFQEFNLRTNLGGSSNFGLNLTDQCSVLDMQSCQLPSIKLKYCQCLQ